MLLPLLLLLLLPTFSAAICHPDEQAVLLQFEGSFSNLNPWFDPEEECCAWFGVQCDETENYVISLHFSAGDLSWTFPILARLKHLQNLYISDVSQHAGPIPSSIQQLSQLRQLSITSSNVSGPIPDSIKHLKNLEYLDISFNRLSGSIPPSLATIPGLSEIQLSGNRLTGPIPESFGLLQALNPTLNLSHNLLSGPLPASLSRVNFSQVDISRNHLSGDASLFFGEGKRNASSIVISRNSFEFDFSKVNFMHMDSLVTLDISHNRIYGNIPRQIIEAVDLQNLNLTYNRLCGEIPTGWKLRNQTENWDSTSFSHNRCLCGAPLEPCK